MRVVVVGNKEATWQRSPFIERRPDTAECRRAQPDCRCGRYDSSLGAAV